MVSLWICQIVYLNNIPNPVDTFRLEGPFMWQKLSILMLLLSLPMACKKAEPTSSKKESVTEQPTEVSGGFGLTMQCTVTNRDVPNASSSEIACVVSNDDGSKFTGTYENLKASVTARNASDKIRITPTQATNDSPVSLIVSVPGVKPDDSLSVQVEGKFDDAPAVLSASLLGPFALTCSRDVTYWVESGTPDPTNLTCSEQKPCRTIGQAIALIPDIINCNLTINVKQGTYEEALTIASREIRPNKTIRIKGVEGTPIIKAPTDLPKATPDEITASFADKGLRTAIQISSILAKNAFIEFENIEIQGGAQLESPVEAAGSTEAKTMYEVSQDKPGKFETGIYASTSSLKLTNVKLTGFSHVALLLDQSSRLVTASADATRPALEINTSRVGIRAQDVDRIFFSKDTEIIGNGDIQDGAGVDLARTISVRFLEEATLNIKDLAYGIIADKTLIQPASAKAGIDIENVFTGLHLVNYSEFIWEPKLSETKTSYLKIKKCYFVCIDTDSSVLKLISEDVNPAETTKKRLLLELDTRLTGDDRYSDRLHFGLMRASNSSTVDFSYLDNQWCSVGNNNNCQSDSDCNTRGDFYAMTVESNSRLAYSRYSYLSVENPIKFDCEDHFEPSAKYIRNYGYLQQKQNNTCPAGTWPKNSRDCYANLGQAVQYTKNPTQGEDGRKILPPDSLLPFQYPDKNSVLITNGPFTQPTAGGQDLAVDTSGFQTITSVKVDNVSAPIVSFNPNYSSDRQRVIIIPPPHNETSNLLIHQQALLEVTGLSLSSPNTQVTAKNKISYYKECPKNYFSVAEDSEIGTQSFCIMRFEAKDQSSRTISEPDGLPIVNVTRDQANAKCQSISPYYRLMSNVEWQAMARKTETLLTGPQQWLANWNDTDTFMRMGHSDNDPPAPLTATNEIPAPCFKTEEGLTNEETCDPSQWRYLRISDDARVWDIAGNVAEWVSDNYTVTGTPDADSYISQITDSTLKSKFGPAGDYSGYSEFYAGLGYLKINAPAGTYGIARGGSYLDGDKSGVFAADATLDPAQGYPNVGFRCVVVPPATVP
jgi:formylglycine-generating enzyme required for sulfatase activity